MPWNDTEELLVAASGQVYIAPEGTTVPTTTTGALNAAFTGLGYISEDGASINSTPESTDFGVWQSRHPIRREFVSQELQISFALVQWNENTVPLAFGGGAISGSTPNYRYDFPDDDDVMNIVSVVLDAADGANHMRWVFRRATLTDAVETQFQRGALAMLPLALKVLAPDGGGSPGYFLTDAPGFAAGS